MKALAMVFCGNYFFFNSVLWWAIFIVYSLPIAASTPRSQNFIRSTIDYAPCPRIRYIANYIKLPLVVASIIREYELLGYRHAVKIGDLISAVCILPRNRIAIATSRGCMLVFNYLTLTNQYAWNAHQEYISKIEFTSTSAETSDERIISTDSITDSVKIWNGVGHLLSAMKNIYTYHPCLSHPCSFDPATQSMPYARHKISSFVRNSNSPFAIQRKDCEHIIMMGSAPRFVAGFRSGSLEVRSFNALSPRMTWKRMVLNKTNHTKKRPVTALFKLTRNRVVVGFQDGLVEIWSILNGTLQKRWQAHDDSVTDIVSLCGNDILMTATQNFLVGWRIPGYQKSFQMTCPAPLVAACTSEYFVQREQYLILCFRDKFLEVWSL